MDIVKIGMLETELARREVFRNMKEIKKVVTMFQDEARESKTYTRTMAMEAFKIIDHEIEKQTGKWMKADEKKTWDEV